MGFQDIALDILRASLRTHRKAYCAPHWSQVGSGIGGLRDVLFLQEASSSPMPSILPPPIGSSENIVGLNTTGTSSTSGAATGAPLLHA